jgi:hypothetical protein
MSPERTFWPYFILGSLLILASCTSPTNPISSGAAGVTNYYTNTLTNYNQAQIRFQFQHGTVAPIQIMLISELAFTFSYDRVTGLFTKFPSFKTNLIYTYESTSNLFSSNTPFFAVMPGSYYVAISFPTELFSTSFPVVFGEVLGIGGYGDGVKPYQLVGGARYFFNLLVNTTSAQDAYLAWTNMISGVFGGTKYWTQPVDFNPLKLRYEFIRLDGY